MGTKINTLFEGQTITLDDLKKKTLVVDSYNQLYMFLSSIRQPDGSLLRDSHGHVTSHLSGLFHRFTRLMQHDIKFIFVFDGKAPDLKKQERERRAAIKVEAEKKYEEAKQAEDLEAMKKYAQQTAKLTKDMLEEAKKLIKALGFPIIQAPGEGEAQAAFMVKKGDADAILSQDADSFLFGAAVVIKNLTLTGRRKKPGSYAFQEVLPERISLAENLNKLGVDQDQLIVMAILTGTDYNIGGIKGIGPHKALALIKKHGKKIGTIKRKVAIKKKPSEQSILNKIHIVKHNVEKLDEAQHKHMMSGLHKIVGSVSGKYYINYTTDSGYKKMEFFNKLPKGYYKGKDRVLYVTRLTHNGTSLIPIKYTDNNKEVKK